jgi:class 3 adenylate cyclase
MTKEAEQIGAAQVNQYAAQRQRTLEEVRRLIGEIDPAAALRMDTAGSGRIPSSKEPDRSVAYLAEAVRALATAAAEQPKPRKPGRPRKTG